MNRIAEFEKVSFEQFYEATKEYFLEVENAEHIIADIYWNLELPTRATSGSAGYDFKAPWNFELAPGTSIKIPTGIRVKIDEGWWLGCLPRSGLGFKYRLQLDNTMGVIDSDYYYSDNEGHIFLKLTNCGLKKIEVEQGKGFAQGIFVPYGLTHSDNVENIRNGGMGSTDKEG